MNHEPGYCSDARLIVGPPEAVIIHCSDYRFLAAIEEFRQQALAIRSFDLFAVPGGAHFASMGDLMPKHLKVGKQSLKFLVEFHKLRRLILIDHADCAFFKHRLAFFFSEPSFNEKQIANLRNARAVMIDWFPALAVDAYFAEPQGDQRVSFIRIA